MCDHNLGRRNPHSCVHRSWCASQEWLRSCLMLPKCNGYKEEKCNRKCFSVEWRQFFLYTVFGRTYLFFLQFRADNISGTFLIKGNCANIKERQSIICRLGVTAARWLWSSDASLGWSQTKQRVSSITRGNVEQEKGVIHFDSISEESVWEVLAHTCTLMLLQRVQ